MSDTAWDVDVLDPEWRSFERVMERMKPGFAALDRLVSLSRELSAENDAEYERRQAAEPPEQRQRREDRDRTLMELVLRASQTDDPAQWAAVDAIVFGPGAES